MDNTKRKELIEASVKARGYGIESWENDDANEDGTQRAVLGNFIVLEDTDPTMGPFEGEEGVLYAYVVGSEKHDNVRVEFGFQSDGTDIPMTVDLSTLEQI